MQLFAQLFEQLDQTTKTNELIAALHFYLDQVDDADKLWTIALLSGNRPKRQVNSTRMKEWVADLAGIPLWLFEETYQVVGDMAETIALLIPNNQGESVKTLTEWMKEIIDLSEKDDEEKKAFVVEHWRSLNQRERFVFNKLIGGSFRVGVSQKTMVKALATYSGKEENELAHRLMGNWSPETHTYEELILTSEGTEDLSRPYPFYLAYPLDESSDFNAEPSQWIAEYKWDGIRGQLVKREGETYIWTRGEELVTDKYPELVRLSENLPNGVAIDGEILAYQSGRPMPFGALQKRIGRKKVGMKMMEEGPVIRLA